MQEFSGQTKLEGTGPRIFDKSEDSLYGRLYTRYFKKQAYVLAWKYLSQVQERTNAQGHKNSNGGSRQPGLEALHLWQTVREMGGFPASLVGQGSRLLFDEMDETDWKPEDRRLFSKRVGTVLGYSDEAKQQWLESIRQTNMRRCNPLEGDSEVMEREMS